MTHANSFLEMIMSTKNKRKIIVNKNYKWNYKNDFLAVVFVWCHMSSGIHKGHVTRRNIKTALRWTAQRICLTHSKVWGGLKHQTDIGIRFGCDN